MYARFIYLAGLLETLVDLEAFKVMLSAVESSLHKKSASEMSRLERSMASTRVLAFSKDQTQPVAGFLDNVRLCLTDWVEEQASKIIGNEASDLREGSYAEALTFVRPIFSFSKNLSATFGMSSTLPSTASLTTGPFQHTSQLVMRSWLMLPSVKLLIV